VYRCLSKATFVMLVCLFTRHLYRGAIEDLAQLIGLTITLMVSVPLLSTIIFSGYVIVRYFFLYKSYLCTQWIGTYPFRLLNNVEFWLLFSAQRLLLLVS